MSNGETGTNTQEAGVDEPDVAKTDGRIVVRLVEHKRLVVTDVSGESAREIADLMLPSDGFATGLLLVGDHVLLTGDRGANMLLEDDGMDRTIPTAGTELYDVDVSDPANPQLDSRTSWSGRQLSLRQYDDTVRLVTSNGLPQLPFVQPGSGSDSGFGSGELSEGEAEQRNREIVRKSTVQDWAPGLDCSDVYHPRTWSGSETVSVATFRPGAVDAATKVAVTGAGNEVYSSADRLYVTATNWGDQVVSDRPMTSSENPDFLPPSPTRTHIHAFALEGDSSRYLASGDISGTIKDRWSLDEYDGHLRVAVSWPGRGGSTGENGVVVLDERDGRLETVGELRGLGVDEQIKSVRWFDDLAVVVTFRQTDPLYTIDLTDPTSPRRLGELKIPGFSSYLHPIGDDRAAGPRHRRHPRRTHDGRAGSRVRHPRPEPGTSGRQGHLRRERRSAASEDPHAFTWLPDADAAITTLQSSGMVSGMEPGMEPGIGTRHRAECGADRGSRDDPAAGLPVRRAVHRRAALARWVRAAVAPARQRPGRPDRIDGQDRRLSIEALRRTLVRMCRNIRTLHNFEPPASRDEVHGAALQYVRKISGATKPSQANQEAFDQAVVEVEAATRRLLEHLTTNAPPKNREEEAAKARARSEQRYARA